MDDVDVLVVGGGINGAGIARDLAGRGLRVLLCEQHDLAAHTSSASTKLIHGGLRYLEQYKFRLVQKALAERERLLKSAPHIMRPLRFVMPHDPSMRPVWMIRIGLFLYDHLARREWLPASCTVRLREHVAGQPLKAQFTHGFVYSDGWVDDARLVVLNAIDAAERGAEVVTRCVCTSTQRQPGASAQRQPGASAQRQAGVGDAAGHWLVHLQPEGAPPRSVRARALVNAAGPWAAEFLRDKVQARSARALRLVKGSHVVVPSLFEHDMAYIFQNPDGRIIFAIPYEGRFTLIGTTDVEVHDAPGQARIDADEIAYLCEQASRYFAKPVQPADVVWSYSGVRPLLDDEAGNASAVTRDYLLEFDDGGDADGSGVGGGEDSSPAPLLTVWGGKITTFRKLAEEAADALVQRLGQGAAAWTETALLPGADLSRWIGPPKRPDRDIARFIAALIAQHPHIEPALLTRWARAYGARVQIMLDQLAVADPSVNPSANPAVNPAVDLSPGSDVLGRAVAPGLYQIELNYLRQHEWARSADDVLWRRSKLGLHLSPGQREQVARWWG